MRRANLRRREARVRRLNFEKMEERRLLAAMVGLGDLPGREFSSGAVDVSADGSVVVGRSRSANGPEAFRWTAAGGMVGLGDLPGGIFESSASGVSADGSVVVGVGRVQASGRISAEAFRWTAESGMVGLGDLPGGLFQSHARDVSADGSVVVGRSISAVSTLANENATEAFRWTAAGGMVGLGDLPGGDFWSQAISVSADGSVVVGTSHSANGPEAFRWTAESGMVGLGDLPGGLFQSHARNVSADGSVVVGASRRAGSLWEAFRWTAAGGMVGLGDLPGGQFYSQAAGVSADGSVVVGASSSANGFEAFRWTAQSDPPDIAVTSLTIVRDNVNFKWEITGADLPADTEVALYWSDNRTFEAGTDVRAHPPRPVTGTDREARTQPYMHSVPISALSTPPTGTRYLLLVADPNADIDDDTTNDVKYLNASCDTLTDNVSVSLMRPDGIKATFAPITPSGQTVSLKFAAFVCGVDHFNWQQVVTQDPYYFDFAPHVPYFDPFPGKLRDGSAIPADGEPFYWDEGNHPVGPYHLNTWTEDTTLEFQDFPFDRRLQPGESIEFTTTLVGVRNAGSPKPYYTFQWFTNYTRTSGSVGSRQNVFPNPDGSGGVFGLREDVDFASLPPEVQEIILTGVQPVEFDIKPDSDVNSVNLKSKGTIPVAVLSTNAFDATTRVERKSLTFGVTGDEDSLHRRGNGEPNCGAEDVNGDGQPDLVCHFHTQKTGFDAESTEGILKSLLLDGTPIKGRDTIQIVEGVKKSVAAHFVTVFDSAFATRPYKFSLPVGQSEKMHTNVVDNSVYTLKRPPRPSASLISDVVDDIIGRDNKEDLFDAASSWLDDILRGEHSWAVL